MNQETRIYLAGTWIVVMLIYLLGDVLRVYSGEITPGELGGMKATQAMFLGIAVLMLIPILMVFFSLTMGYPVIRWLNIIVALFFFLFNLVALPTYPSAYDRFLLLVSMVFNLVTVWYAVRWEA
jgi:hypothetical protein